ncbi:MAG TPA: UdgX family uracil-DNA binding protein [Segeticoccus sp.]|uniref:UdgX family uracil-DNA binding protein n=1 Tax=Segeticoccus sp. TaxID=2706531 RepID=UPI002D7F259A|nr:UdgX family uracil-DNA binding protein [Segeticoccus sp.]HET8601359.1 UdgX family uracil-DNA binding protein [Segeticoccus sp.]
MAEELERPGAEQWVPESGGIAALRRAAPGCRGCELWEPATQVVFSSGSAHARIVMVGEEPGDAEDLAGEPFVGPAGKLLRRAIEEAGIAMEEVYLTNAIKHFSFVQRGKRRIHRKPDLAQMVACRPWLEAELRYVDPDLTVLLGASAARQVLGPGIKVTQQRGQVLTRETTLGERRFIPTVHPSSILRARERRHDAYAAFVADLKVVAKAV